MAVVLDSSCNTRVYKAKSHTSIYDIYAPTRNDVHYTKYIKTCPNHEMTADPHRKYSEVRESIRLSQYVTSEKYHALNKRSSDKSVVRSTSTLFYDLDNLAKRHSYHCVADFGVSTHKVNVSLGTKRSFTNKSGFDAKSKAIVQDCTTEVQPKVTPRDSVTINRRIKKFTKTSSLNSSDIFLNDTDYIGKQGNIQPRFNEKDQKFWSYSKYKTEYTKPMSEERRQRIKNNDKNNDDPCPCQLFSYACPCTDKKSLTNLAKNSKTVTASNQVSCVLKSKVSYYKNNTTTDRNLVDKVTSPTTSEMLPEYNVARVSNQMSPQSINHKNISNHTCPEIRCSHSPKQKCHRKPRQIICPKCKERIEITSITEEVEHMNNPQIRHQMQENFSPGQQSYASNFSQRSKLDGDLCSHDPPCELVPVCQILPSEQAFANSTKCFKMESTMKSNARTIKITKACRHHPPCTVVPSCQRMRVLSNNCEYIPPCLHRPRCVNLPLCIPFSKTIDYDELLNKQFKEEDILKCHHMYSTPAYVPVYQNESVARNVQQHFQAMHKPEYDQDYEPTFFLSPKLTRTSPTFAPCQNQTPTNKQSPMSCSCPKNNKSCQYECTDCKCENSNVAKKSVSDVIVYIRDVGCQFRNKHSQGSKILQSHTSNASYGEDTAQMGKYFSNYHTLRYEDKYTNPVSGGEQTITSSSSFEIDSHCPSHGMDKNPANSEINTGFRPRTSPVVANCYLNDPILEHWISTNKDLNKKRRKSQSVLYTASSRKSFVKSKHKKSSVKRRRKSRLSYQSVLNSGSKKLH